MVTYNCTVVELNTEKLSTEFNELFLCTRFQNLLQHLHTFGDFGGLFIFYRFQGL